MKLLLKSTILGFMIVLVVGYGAHIIKSSENKDKEYKYHVYYKAAMRSGRAMVTLNVELNSNIALLKVEEYLKNDISGFDPNDPLIVVSWKQLEK